VEQTAETAPKPRRHQSFGLSNAGYDIRPVWFERWGLGRRLVGSVAGESARQQLGTGKRTDSPVAGAAWLF